MARFGVKCPACGVTNELESSQIAASGTVVSCGSCQHAFIAHPPPGLDTAAPPRSSSTLPEIPRSSSTLPPVTGSHPAYAHPAFATAPFSHAPHTHTGTHSAPWGNPHSNPHGNPHGASHAPTHTASHTSPGMMVEPVAAREQWLIKTPDGNLYVAPNEKTLILWILESRVLSDDMLSVNNQPYQRMGDIPAYTAFFHRALETAALDTGTDHGQKKFDNPDPAPASDNPKPDDPAQSGGVKPVTRAISDAFNAVTSGQPDESKPASSANTSPEATADANESKAVGQVAQKSKSARSRGGKPVTATVAVGPAPARPSTPSPSTLPAPVPPVSGGRTGTLANAHLVVTGKVISEEAAAVPPRKPGATDAELAVPSNPLAESRAELPADPPADQQYSQHAEQHAGTAETVPEAPPQPASTMPPLVTHRPTTTSRVTATGVRGAVESRPIAKSELPPVPPLPEIPVAARPATGQHTTAPGARPITRTAPPRTSEIEDFVSSAMGIAPDLTPERELSRPMTRVPDDPDLKAFEKRAKRSKGKPVVIALIASAVIAAAAAVFFSLQSKLPAEMEGHVARTLETIERDEIDKFEEVETLLRADIDKVKNNPRLDLALAHLLITWGEHLKRDGEYTLDRARKIGLSADGELYRREAKRLIERSESLRTQGADLGIVGVGKIDAAVRLAQKGYNAARQDPYAHVVVGEYERIRGNLKAAREHVSFIRQVNARHHGAALLEASLSVNDRAHVDDAIKALDTLLKANPKLNRVRYLYALALYTAGRLTEARQQFEIVLREVPGHTGAKLRLDALDEPFGAERDMLEAANRAANPTPEEVLKGIDKARDLAYQQKLDIAARELEALAQKFPDEAELPAMLASIYAERGDKNGARKWGQTYVKRFAGGSRANQVRRLLAELDERE